MSGLQNEYLKIFDYDAFQNAPVDFACLSFNLNQNKLVAFEKRNMGPEDFVPQAVFEHGVFSGVPAYSNREDYYADGGYEQRCRRPVRENGRRGSCLSFDLAEPGEKVAKISTPHIRIRPLMKATLGVGLRSQGHGS